MSVPPPSGAPLFSRDFLRLLGGAACALIVLGAVTLIFDVVDAWLGGAAVVVGVLALLATLDAWRFGGDVPRPPGWRRRRIRSLTTSVLAALGATAAIVAGAPVPLVAAAVVVAAVASAIPGVLRAAREARRPPADGNEGEV